MIIKRLLRPFNEWEAYKHGIIDAKGKRIRKPRTAKEREGWDILDRFCWSIKRLLGKVGVDNKLAYLFSAAYLMKESYCVVVNENMDRYKSDLVDFDIYKQKELYEIFQQLESIGCIKESKLDFETNLMKLYISIHDFVDLSTISCMFTEDEVCGATALGDVAMFTPVINTTKRINKNRINRRGKTLRIKRSKHHGNTNKK
jgi:hypothetical protein